MNGWIGKVTSWQTNGVGLFKFYILMAGEADQTMDWHT